MSQVSKHDFGRLSSLKHRPKPKRKPVQRILNWEAEDPFESLESLAEQERREIDGEDLVITDDDIPF